MITRGGKYPFQKEKMGEYDIFGPKYGLKKLILLERQVGQVAGTLQRPPGRQVMFQ